MSAASAILIAFLAALLLRGAALVRGSRDRGVLAEDRLLARMARLPGAAQAWGRAALLATGAAGLAAAAVGGREGPPPPGVADDRETVLVLDASNSMLAQDVAPSRLERQQQLARRMAAGLSHRMGVVFFAGRGYVLSPLTADRDAVLLFVDAVDPSVVGRGGTALASGLSQALDVLAGGEDGARRAVLLFSDGESTAEADDLGRVVERAMRAGIPIHTIGLGTATGARVPLDRIPVAGGAAAAPDSGPAGFLRDPSGQFVITRLEERSLRATSSATGGLYVPGTTAGVDRLLQELSRGEAARAGFVDRAALDALVLLAFLLLWADGFLFRRG